MALFESYERRIDKINGVLAQYGLSSVEACRELCQSKGFDPYEIAKSILCEISDSDSESAVSVVLYPLV